jgi:hypothetical protein
MSVPLTFPGLTCIAVGSLIQYRFYIISCAFYQHSAYIMICMDFRKMKEYFATTLTASCLYPKRNVFTAR